MDLRSCLRAADFGDFDILAGEYEHYAATKEWLTPDALQPSLAWMTKGIYFVHSQGNYVHARVLFTEIETNLSDCANNRAKPRKD